VLCTTVVHNDMHTHEQLLKLSVGSHLYLDFMWVHFSLEFSFCFSLGLFCCCVVCFCCVRFSFFSTMPRAWLGRMPPNDLFLCVKCDIQEGQHPLTGQRATNFRLLANQWAERNLVTQWHHGYCAMRRSVCNAGASNVGSSLCIQISRTQSYPLPIYWQHSKGNWLRYNFAANSFYTMKLCSRLFVLYCRNCPKDDKSR